MNYLRKIRLLSRKKSKGTRTKAFRFLDLPRELRDHIYEQIWKESHDDAPTFVQDSWNQRSRYVPPGNPQSAIVRVNRQVYSESMDVLYRPFTFVVHLEYMTPRLERCTSLNSPSEFDCAIPFVWRVEFMRKLVIHVDLSWAQTTNKTLRALEWPALSKMERLGSLRMVIMHGHAQARKGGRVKDEGSPDQSAAKYIDDNGREKLGTKEFRNMLYGLMANFPSNLTKVIFGGNVPLRSRLANATCIDGRFLIQVVETFEKLGLWEGRNKPQLVSSDDLDHAH